MMQISKTGIDLIKSFEGCSLKAYLCPAKVWTIGWGTTGTVDSKKIGAGMTITQSKADSLLTSRLVSYENAVKKYVTYNINQNQYDALVSFTYNCGAGALQKSDLLKHLNKGNVTAAANQFDLWTRGGGVVLAGLVRRRAAEKKLFLTPVKKDVDLEKAVQVLVIRNIIGSPAAWGSVEAINLKNVPALLSKMGGVDRLAKDKVISDTLLWTSGTYKADHVRSLIIKYANLG
jgi:GH24 family phage-related lysozyme (muramidase)